MQIPPSLSLLHTLGAVAGNTAAKPALAKPAPVAAAFHPTTPRAVAPPQQQLATAAPQVQAQKPAATLPRGSLLNITV